jgi:uncharacterized protein (DUF433 family)
MRKPMFPDKYDWQGCDAVQFNPEKLSGRATVGATRMDADGVLENYLAGMTAAEIADCFDIDQDAVESILAFAAAKGLKATA